MSRPTFVFDVDIPPFMENRVFDVEYARQFPGADAFAALGSALRAAGLETVTADVYLTGPNAGRPAVCLSNELTRFTDQLLSFDAVIPVACMSLESPIVAIDFYTRIREVSDRFAHLFLWSGMRDTAGGKATFHNVAWPYPDSAPTIQRPAWQERGFTVLVNSNKRIFVPLRRLLELRHPRRTAKRLIAAGRLSRLRRSRQWLASELYKDRLDAIRHFATSDDFDLFGRGWSDESTLSVTEAHAVARSYRGELPADAKVPTLAKYRFALCFENTSFPGYITEKIFDCFQAGCIPVYHGAPDVATLIPTSTFIDARDFRELADLETFMRALSPKSARKYVDAATDFMRTRGSRFSQAHFVRSMSDVLLQAASQAGLTAESSSSQEASRAGVG